MPQKYNRAGQLQNYVPAGNGDASGEYGDNASGSNKHFTSFKKPDETSKTSTINQVSTNNAQTTSEETTEKKETRWNELSKKQKKEIGMYVFERKDRNNDNLIRVLRYYTGSFGDLSNFSDEELKDIIDKIKNINASSDISEKLYFKENGKWESTYYPKEFLDELGIESYTQEEKDAKEIEESIKTLETSRTEQDKNIQKIVGEKCVVCFGKGYSAKDLEQIARDTQTYVNDFPELKNTLKAIGDRANLEKYINSLRMTTTPSEEDIAKEMAKIKKFSFYEISDENARKRAIENLKSKITLKKLNRAYAYWSPREHFMIYMAKMKKLVDEQTDYEYDVNFHSSNKRNATFTHEMGHAVDTALKEYYEKIYNKLESKIPDYEDETDTRSYEEKMKIRNEIKPKLVALEKIRDNFRDTISIMKWENRNGNYKNIFEKTFMETFGVSVNDKSLDYNTRENYKEQIRKKLFNDGIKEYNLSKYGATNREEFVAESFSAYYTGMNNELANKCVNAFKKYAEDLRGFDL